MAPTVTVSRAALAISGVSPGRLHQPELTDEEKVALGAILTPLGFDLTGAIHVDELPADQGFHLTQ